MNSPEIEGEDRTSSDPPFNFNPNSDSGAARHEALLDPNASQYREADDPLIGATLAGRYEVLSAIGRGGMGVVYRGRHILMDKIVAIKVLNSSYVNEPGALLRFQQEAKIACQLNHPNIVIVHDFGVANDTMLYLVMDYIEGQTLAQLLDDKVQLPVSRVLKIAAQLCDGLEYAHDQELIHRDLKPGNIMIVPAKDGSDQVKILDFGLAKFLGEGKQQALSATGFVLGTGYYMSPEQSRGKKADVRSEIYAIGCVLFESLTGMPPLVGENLLETCQKHIEEAPKPMREARPDLDIPDSVQALVDKALQKDPAARFQTARDLKNGIMAIDANEPKLAHAPSPPEAPIVAPSNPVSSAVPTTPSADGQTPPGPVPVPVRSSVKTLAVSLALMAGIGAISAIYFASNTSNHSSTSPKTGSGQSAPFESVSQSSIQASSTTSPAPLQASTNAQSSDAGRALWKKYFQDASTAFDQEKYDRAERLLQRAVLEARHNSDTAEVLQSLRKLEDVLYVQRKFADADALDREIQRLSTGVVASAPSGSSAQVSGVNTATKNAPEPQDDRIAHLAISCHKNGQCDTAVSLLEHAVQISKRVNGPNSLKTATRITELASLYVALDQPNKAQPLMDQVMEIKAAHGKSVTPAHK